MKKILTLFALLVLTVTGAQAQSLTYTISKTTGTFTSGNAGGTWFNTWTSNDGTAPVVTLRRSSGANDMTWDGERFKFSAKGSNNTDTQNANGGLDYTITLPSEYTIDALEATFSNTTAREAYVQIGDVAKKVANGSSATLTFEGLSGNTITVKMKNNANVADNRYLFTPSITLTCHELGAMADVTFNVVDANNNLLATKTVEMEVGSTVSDIPSDLKRGFTTYALSPASLTVSETAADNVVTATATFNLPFEISENFDNAKWYYLNLKGGTGFPTYVEGGNPNVTLPTSNAENDNTSWAFLGNPYAGFQIINKAAGAGNVLGSDQTVHGQNNNGGDVYATLNTPGTKARETWTIQASSHYTNGFFIRNADGHALNHRSSPNVAYCTGGDGNGSTFTVAKVPEREISYIQALENMENGKVYAIYNSRGIWKFAANATSMSTESVPSDLEALCATPADAYQIGIVKQNDKYYLYNVAQGKYLAAGNKLYDSPLESVTITASTSSAATGNYKWFFSFDSSHNINVSSGKVLIDNWTTHDGGNVNAIMVTDATYTVDDALAAFTDYTQCITDYRDYKGISNIVSHIGELGYPKAGTTATTDLTDILARNASGENTEADWNTFVEKFNAFKATDNRTMPEAGNFYRIKGVAGGRYLQSTVSTTAADGRAGVRLGATDNADVTTIFYLDGNKLLGYSNGLYVTNTCDFNNLNSADATTFTITARDAFGEFAVKNGSTFLFSWDGTTNYCFDRQGSDAAQCRMAIEAVTELPITLRSTDNVNYFATFSAPVNVQISGATLNNVVKKSKTASYEAVDTDMLPAATGVLLTGTDASATATIITDDVAAANYGLESYYAATAGTGATDKLYLGKGKTSGKAGFYKLGEGTTSNGFKAYLEDTAAASGEAKEGFELVFGGEVTGVETIDNGQLTIDNSAVYNLQGQRVNKAQKGVYIQNGKKVVLK